jgi:hypothetical protein
MYRGRRQQFEAGLKERLRCAEMQLVAAISFDEGVRNFVCGA